ncbi:MAG: hypothetical protein ACI9E5_000619 [Candidatus Omnitrophota bacterium]|jgi:hypothetical protein
MKYFRIIILITFVLSFIPLEAFCDDHHHETTEHTHCITACHGACHGAVLNSIEIFEPREVVEPFLSAQEFSYNEPFLPAEYRPPVTLS